jgi:hypothetical protein
MLNQEFFNVFTAWLHADVINFRDSQEVEDAARTCAADLKTRRFVLGDLIAELTRILETWELKDRMKFIDATDWLYDAETDQILKNILAIMINDLKYYQHLEKNENI